MMLKPIREWRVVPKCFFLLFGFFLAMLLFPKEEDVAVGTEMTTAVKSVSLDFFGDFREKREKRRGEKLEWYQMLLQDTTITQEEKKTIYTEMDSFLQKNAAEDKVEAILKGRGYEDVIFSNENALSLLILKGEDPSEGKKGEIMAFLQAYTGISPDKLSIFSIEK